MNKLINSFKSKNFKIGGYSIAVIAICLAIVVLINIFISTLPAEVIKIDTTNNQLYTLTEETKNIVRKVDKDINIYFIATSGKENDTIKQILNRYESVNNRIKVKLVDPATNPGFIEKYTDEKLNESSVIVESDLRNRVIDYSEIFKTTYSEQDYMNMYYYNIQPTGTVSFCGESEFTSAIMYVTDIEVPTIYTIMGHGDSSFDSVMMKYFDDDNITLKELSLLTVDKVPSDASAVAIITPESDITELEEQKLTEYLSNGGNLMLFTNYTSKGLNRIYGIAAKYGAIGNDGLTLDENPNYYISGTPNFLLPKIQSNEISEMLSSTKIYVGMTNANSITKAETLPENITYTSLLKTSNAGYIKDITKEVQTLEKEENDISGQFDLGVILKNTENNSTVLWFASDGIIDSAVDTYISGGNSTFFLTSISNLFDKEESVSIASKSMNIEALTVTEGSRNLWSALFIFIIPAFTLIVGLFIWIKRKKA